MLQAGLKNLELASIQVKENKLKDGKMIMLQVRLLKIFAKFVGAPVPEKAEGSGSEKEGKGDDSSYDEELDDGDYGDYGAEFGMDLEKYGASGSEDGGEAEDQPDDALLLRGVTRCHFDPEHPDQLQTPRQTLIESMKEAIRGLGQNNIGMILDGQIFEPEERQAIESCFN